MAKRVNVRMVDAEKLKAYIVGTGQTLESFSYAIGHSKAYLSNMHGQKEFYEGKIQIICEKLGVDGHYFDCATQQEDPKKNLDEIINEIRRTQEAAEQNGLLLNDTITLCQGIASTQKNNQEYIGKMNDDFAKTFFRLTESVDVIRKKVAANTVQLERILDAEGRKAQNK